MLNLTVTSFNNNRRTIDLNTRVARSRLKAKSDSQHSHLAVVFVKALVYSKEPKIVTNFNLSTLFHADLTQSEDNWKMPSASDWINEMTMKSL